MRKFREKPCRNCGKVFVPTAPCNLYCGDECAQPHMIAAKKAAGWRKWVKKAAIEGRSHVVGTGRGGTTKKYKEDNQYKNGIGQFNRLRPLIREQRRYCERCNKDLKDVNNHSWCVHHKDHDRTHNDPENLELLCKRCHQIEHECWKAFEGATTIPKGSTPEANAGGSAQPDESR